MASKHLSKLHDDIVQPGGVAGSNTLDEMLDFYFEHPTASPKVVDISPRYDDHDDDYGYRHVGG